MSVCIFSGANFFTSDTTTTYGIAASYNIDRLFDGRIAGYS